MAKDGSPLAKRGKREARAEGLVSSTEETINNPTKPMPLYEYLCRKCHKKFDEVLTIKEHETKELHCPKCQSTDLEKVIEPFFARTASKTH